MRVLRFLWSWPVTIAAFIAITATSTLSDYVGKLEGKYFPVISEVSIQIDKSIENYGSLVSGSFVKNRDCSFDRIEWYVFSVATNRGESVQHRFLEKSVGRPVGVQEFGPWEVQATTTQFEANMVYASVYHNCHPLWPTITNFYP